MSDCNVGRVPVYLQNNFNESIGTFINHETRHSLLLFVEKVRLESTKHFFYKRALFLNEFEYMKLICLICG